VPLIDVGGVAVLSDPSDPEGWLVVGLQFQRDCPARVRNERNEQLLRMPGPAYLGPWKITTVRLSAIVVPPTVARDQIMISLQVPDAVQSFSWRASLSSSWDVSLSYPTQVTV